MQGNRRRTVLTIASRAARSITWTSRAIQSILQNARINLVPEFRTNTIINLSNKHVRAIDNDALRPICREQRPLQASRASITAWRPRRRHRRPRLDQLGTDRFLRGVEAAIPVWQREAIEVPEDERDLGGVRRAEEREGMRVVRDPGLPGAGRRVVEGVGVHGDATLGCEEQGAVGGAFVGVVGDYGGHGEVDGERGGGEEGEGEGGVDCCGVQTEVVGKEGGVVG